ncbi:hypothetical protein L1887_47880 [Cichorium endivia]|nr:hypothetical protein L1887_47880 [Cichorium endivia]
MLGADVRIDGWMLPSSEQTTPRRDAGMEEWTCGDAGAKSKRESQKKRIEKGRWRRREVDVWRIKNGDPDARLMQTRRWRRRPSERQRQSANGGSSDLAIQAGRQAAAASKAAWRQTSCCTAVLVWPRLCPLGLPTAVGTSLCADAVVRLWLSQSVGRPPPLSDSLFVSLCVREIHLAAAWLEKLKSSSTGDAVETDSTLPRERTLSYRAIGSHPNHKLTYRKTPPQLQHDDRTVSAGSRQAHRPRPSCAAPRSC